MRTKNSVKQVIEYLAVRPFRTETQIMNDIWRYVRGGIFSNKKYADLLRRGLKKGLYSRINVKLKGNRSQYFYYIQR